jgi:hypothetical protein
MGQQNNEPINLLWTGGWDSTFRLLQLLILHKKIVQPYYIIDPNRLSTGEELNAMQDIKRSIFAQYAQSRELLLPTVYKELVDISPNRNITSAYERLIKNTHFGVQYEWLARFSKEIGIKGIEIGYARAAFGLQLLNPFIVQVDSQGETNYAIGEKFHGSDEYELFQFYLFPIINLTKLDQGIIARNEGFYNILSLTWFCHTPLANRQPCGVCTPCQQTIEFGLGWRIPFWSRVRYYPAKIIIHSKLLMKIWHFLKRK